MDKSCIYEIRVEGHLTDSWSDWFDGLAIRNDPNGGNDDDWNVD